MWHKRHKSVSSRLERRECKELPHNRTAARRFTVSSDSLVVDGHGIPGVAAVVPQRQHPVAERPPGEVAAGRLGVQDRHAVDRPRDHPMRMAREVALRTGRETGVDPLPADGLRTVLVRIALIDAARERRDVRRDDDRLAGRRPSPTPAPA